MKKDKQKVIDILAECGINAMAADRIYAKLNEKRGGARKGAGPKLKYGEPTVTVSIRVPASRAEHVKSLVTSYLDWFTDSQKTPVLPEQ